MEKNWKAIAATACAGLAVVGGVVVNTSVSATAMTDVSASAGASYTTTRAAWCTNVSGQSVYTTQTNMGAAAADARARHPGATFGSAPGGC